MYTVVFLMFFPLFFYAADYVVININFLVDNIKPAVFVFFSSFPLSSSFPFSNSHLEQQNHCAKMSATNNTFLSHCNILFQTKYWSLIQFKQVSYFLFSECEQERQKEDKTNSKMESFPLQYSANLPISNVRAVCE